jgi:putative NIF3 family GTP cyclohydrolase 1 type 2
MADLSRREFTALATAVAAASLAVNRVAAGPAITAQDVIDRIKKNIGVEWKAETLDALKAGDPSTVVTGVVTTSMATLTVLQQAVKAGANLVITTHPTFYARTDATSPPAGRGAGSGPAGAGQNPAAPSAPPIADPVFTGKTDYIASNKLVVFRLTDHWRLRQPEPRALGIATALGWMKGQTAGDPLRIEIAALTLDRLADHVRTGLNVRGGIRVIGDPQTKVQRVGLLPGSTPIQAALQLLPTVDAIVAGEVREWESAEYVRDKVFAGDKKSLILLGRVVSEEPGMEICASWLKTFVPEVPIRHVAAGDPYWRPA